MRTSRETCAAGISAVAWREEKTLRFLIQYLGNARRESEPLYLKVSSFENRRVQLLASCKLSVLLDPLEQQSN
jgi:hypothetical protein